MQLQMLPFKKRSAWRKQFCKRGFTMDKTRNMLANGRRETFAHPKNGVTFTQIYWGWGRNRGSETINFFDVDTGKNAKERV